MLDRADGSQVAGQHLVDLVGQAVKAKHMIEPLVRRVGNADVVEQAAIAGALNPEVITDQARAEAAATYIARRLDALAPQYEKGWEGHASNDTGLSFRRSLRGVTERRVIDSTMIRSSEARRLDEMAEALQRTYVSHANLRGKDRVLPIGGPIALADAVFALGRKGVQISRYKGLGEMNAEQLWETTLDPNVRSLLQVRAPHAQEADDVFSTLMGDVVEPRREFIQAHALEVANLDV